MGRVVVYLRFPDPRNGRQDPQPILWTQKEEQKLWAALKASTRDVNWTGLARQFNVPTVYILQQAAWLYEKELKLLREKMTQIHAQPAASLREEPSLESSVTSEEPAGRRLMSVSRVYDSDLSGDLDDLGGFVPQNLTSSSEDSISQSALEEALLNQTRTD